MSGKPSRARHDAALWPIIEATDDDAREAAVETLLKTTVNPFIATLLKRFRRMEPHLRPEDLEEMASQVTYQFIRKLRAAVVDDAHSIEGLQKYLATIAYNVFYDFRRAQYPERHRLKRNLRYVITREPGFALWEAGEIPVAGLAQWTGQAAAAVPDAFQPATATRQMRDKSHPVNALKAIFTHIGRPIPFESLVDLVADLWNVCDVIVERDPEDFSPPDRQDQLSVIEQRQYMERLWAEIRELPVHQRAVLLLNMRDAGGSNALVLLLFLQVANVAEIADAAGLSVDELSRLWESLPLDDLTLANRLGLERQQIINMRKSARMRLVRRMSKWK